jgi:hypothetical protein
MRHFFVLFIHLIAILTQLLKHQLLIVNRSRQRSPTLSSWDRILAGWMALLVRPTRLLRSAIVLKPSILSLRACGPRNLMKAVQHNNGPAAPRSPLFSVQL